MILRHKMTQENEVYTSTIAAQVPSAADLGTVPFNYYRENSFEIEFRVRGGGGGPFGFIISPSCFLLGFVMEYFDP